MGLTIAAVLTAALLLPGILAARVFFLAGQTREVEVPIPSLSTPNGISLVGGFSILVHAIYASALLAIERLPPRIPLPPADPYRLLAVPPGAVPLEYAWSFLSGLLLLCVLASLIGLLSGWIAVRLLDRTLFYGPLADVIESAKGDDKFITAYVVTKISVGERFVGYQGTVDSLFRDADRFPAKIVLKDAVPFYLTFGEDGPEREEADQLIDWVVLNAGDWHNVAFRVFQLVDDSEEEKPQGGAATPSPGPRDGRLGDEVQSGPARDDTSRTK